MHPLSMEKYQMPLTTHQQLSRHNIKIDPLKATTCESRVLILMGKMEGQCWRHYISVFIILAVKCITY
jgi:hypothetical protein